MFEFDPNAPAAPHYFSLAHAKKESATNLVPAERIVAWGRGEIQLTYEEHKLLADPPLSAAGVKRARELFATYSKRHGIPPVLFVSDRLRALQTATPWIEAMEYAYGHAAPIYMMRQLGQGDSGDVVSGFPEDHPAYNRQYRMVTFSMDGHETDAVDWAAQTKAAAHAIKAILQIIGLRDQQVPVVISHRPTAAALHCLAATSLDAVTKEDGRIGGKMDPFAPELVEGIYLPIASLHRLCMA